MNKRNSPPAPFSCTFSPNLPELLVQLGCSIAISTFQAGKILLISPKNKEELILLPRNFKKAMGIAVAENRMAIATQNEVIVLKNSPELALTYPKKPQTYDALYVPRATYYTGTVDVHDLHFGTNTLWAVNTSFSCLCTIDDGYSFTPKWTPPFITALASEDRCHLNGLAMENGKPRYITALGRSNKPAGWRENITTGGVLMDVQNNEVVAHGLAMPHTPRIWDDKLYLLLSAAQRLVCVNPQNGEYETVAKVPGFVRGMAKYGDYVFIGTSKLRKNSSTFKDLEIAESANEAAITVIHLPTGAKVGKLTFLASVDELYDIQILPGVQRPNVVNTYGVVHEKNLLLPEHTFWAK